MKDPESADPSYVCAEKEMEFWRAVFSDLFMVVVGWWEVGITVF